MKKIEIITRQEKLDELKELLVVHNLQGLTVMAVMGCGRQRGYIPEMRITAADVNLLPKIYVFTIVEDGVVEKVLADITLKIGTGHAGDGKVFVSTIDDVMRIRTNERGADAL
ncbi:MAG: P-II family nitrogen regulator [Eubacteriaceae bacterium]|jgi:nitrogen regulatory protein P-II 1|nr:P-II family nitrogen regulator [Eubacteriaceae bacterium]